MSSPPMRQARRTSQAYPEGHSRRRSSSQSGIPVSNTGLRASRLANTLPTYDIITGNSVAPSVQPLQQTFRQSQNVRPEPTIGNEDLRAQIKTLQYEVDYMKQDRDVINLRHDNELRQAQNRAEEAFRKAQAEESKTHVPFHEYESLSRELKELQDNVINQQNTLEKRVRSAQEESRSAKEEAEEARDDLSSVDREHKRKLQEIEADHARALQSLSDLRSDLDNKATTLKATQGRLSQRESEVGNLESEVLRLKAQTGDAETLGVIKRELSEQVSHIRKLESTNREQNTQLKHFRQKQKAVEVVEEEKRALESRVSVMEDIQKQLRETQLQREILEDERRSWTSYLQSQGGTGEVDFESPEDLARSLVKQRVENASLVEKMGAMQPELLEKDEIIKSLEKDKNRIQSELDKRKATGTAAGSTDSKTKKALERQRALAWKEVEFLREQLRTFDSEEQTYHSENAFDAQKSTHIAGLEAQIDDHRRELAQLTSELSTLESAVSSVTPKSPLKRSIDEVDSGVQNEQLGQLVRKTRKLNDELSSLQSKHNLLQTEHDATQSQLTSLRASAKTRVLSLRSNPTADHEAIKVSTLDALKQENKDLLARLEDQSVSTVPASTLQSLRLEMQELEREVQGKEKRMLRLKQVWGSKNLEFREAVCSILGWEMVFRPDGKFALSLHASKADGEGGEEEPEDCLIFDGERGTMKVAGGVESEFARRIRPLVKRWVEGRGYIPGLMAGILMERVGEED